METTRKLYELQELDVQIDQAEQSLAQKNNLLGSREMLSAVMQKVSAAQKSFDELKHQRREAEGQVEDTSSKIKTVEQQLYGGTVTSPKELSNLQHEINTLKSHNDELSTKALNIIDQMEEAEKILAEANGEFKKAEEAWQLFQKKLAVEIKSLEASLAQLKPERDQMAAQIEPPVMALYTKLKLQKKHAVARVEQGICHSCRISISVSAVQRARNGQPVQCGNCGRILFIP